VSAIFAFLKKCCCGGGETPTYRQAFNCVTDDQVDAYALIESVILGTIYNVDDVCVYFAGQTTSPGPIVSPGDAYDTCEECVEAAAVCDEVCPERAGNEAMWDTNRTLTAGGGGCMSVGDATFTLFAPGGGTGWGGSHVGVDFTYSAGLTCVGGKWHLELFLSAGASTCTLVFEKCNRLDTPTGTYTYVSGASPDDAACPCAASVFAVVG
jgi:hypothetical protein